VEAILSSMTVRSARSRRSSTAARRKRIARGSGTSVQEVNRLLKQFDEMHRMVKMVKKMGKESSSDSGSPAAGPDRFGPSGRHRAPARRFRQPGGIVERCDPSSTFRGRKHLAFHKVVVADSRARATAGTSRSSATTTRWPSRRFPAS